MREREPREPTLRPDTDLRQTWVDLRRTWDRTETER